MLLLFFFFADTVKALRQKKIDLQCDLKELEQRSEELLPSSWQLLRYKLLMALFRAFEKVHSTLWTHGIFQSSWRKHFLQLIFFIWKKLCQIHPWSRRKCHSCKCFQIKLNLFWYSTFQFCEIIFFLNI